MGDVLTFASRPKAPEAVAAEPRPITEAEIRERLGAVLQNALDVADDIIAVLDRMDGCPDDEDGGDAEPSLAAPEDHACQTGWCRGGDDDREAEAGEAVLPEVAIEPAVPVPPAPAIVIPLPPLRWAGAGNVLAAAGVALVDLLERA